MNNLLLFFALPVATIILSVVLQRLLKSPILVALTAFAIYLIVAFAAFDETFLVFVIAYTILAFLSAVAAKFIMRLIRCQRNCNNNGNNNEDTDDDMDDNNDEDNCECRENITSRNGDTIGMNYYSHYRGNSRRF